MPEQFDPPPAPTTADKRRVISAGFVDSTGELAQLARSALKVAQGRWAVVMLDEGGTSGSAATAGQVTPELLAAMPGELSCASTEWCDAAALGEAAQSLCQADPQLRWLAHLPLPATRSQPRGALWVAVDEPSAELLADLAWLTRGTAEQLAATRAAQDLRLATIRLESLVTNLQDGLLVEDENGRVTHANRQFCDLFCIPAPPEWLHGQLCVDLMAQAGPMVGDIGAFMARVNQLLAEHQLVTGEIIVLTDERVLQRDFIPYDDGTGKHARMWQYRDITARVRAEQAEHAHAERLAAANAQLEEATRLKDEFLASMSHELRTPLNAVLGMSEALADQVFGAIRPEQIRPLQAISDSGHHLLTMINDLLDLARIGAGKLELDLDTVDVNSLMTSVAYLLRPAAARKQVSLSAQVTPAIPLVRADARRLKQILVNLVDNGIKFTPEGGSVGLEVALDAAGSTLELSVWDTGQGIAASDIPKLFKAFAQLERGLNRKHQGAGMGLMMAERLAALHGGWLSVVSEVQRGSRFTVHLPLEPGPAGQPNAAPLADGSTPDALPVAALAPGSLAPLVLVAEDNELNLEIIQRFLITKGYRVAAARDGQAALALAALAKPAVVLMDVQMPGMDGLEATRRMRQDPQFRHLPVIALTALAMEGDRERCMAAGATAYLAKPVSLRQLAQLLQRYVHGESENPKA